MNRTLAAGLLLCILAGCSDPAAPGGAAGTDADGTGSVVPTDRGSVLGTVLDSVLRPVSGANVTAASVKVPSTSTGDDGAFLLHLPPGEHALRITADGFQPHAVSVRVEAGARAGLNVTLERLPPPPRVEVQTFQGFIHCDVIVQPTHSHGSNHTHNNQRCDAALGEARHVWDLGLRAGVDGLVVEVAWEPNHDLSRYLYVRVEAEDGSLLADTEMDGPLRLQVAQAQLRQHVPDGGTLRVVALVGTGEDAGGGNDLGVAAQFQQEFEAFASAFYGEPSPPDYALLR